MSGSTVNILNMSVLIFSPKKRRKKRRITYTEAGKKIYKHLVRDERCFAEIGVHRKAVSHYKFFFKNIYKVVEFYLCRQRACNFM